jgi:hypothetical protein
VAPFLNNATVAVFPSVPAGFVGGSIGTAAVVGIVGAGAAAAGTAAVVVSNNNNDTTTTTVAVNVNATTTTTVVAATTTTTTTTTLPNNKAPFAVLNVSPDPPSGNGPLTVTFDLCKSTDPEKDPLNFFFDFGDGAKATGSCLESHTYQSSFRSTANVRALDRSYVAEGCVVDPGGLSACRSRNVLATTPAPACPGPPTIVMTPPPGVVTGCSGFTADLPVQATANNATSVTFCLESVGCPFLATEVQSAALPPTCVPGSASGNSYTATLKVGFGCWRVTADATGCGGKASAGPFFTQNFDCGFRGESARPGQERSASWTSDLTVEGGRLQIVVNGAAPVFSARGRGVGTARLVDGENRVEAVLVETAGKAGLWRIDLNPSESIAEGSLRVISGEAVLLGASSATFRLTGHEGERIVFTFLKK